MHSDPAPTVERAALRAARDSGMPLLLAVSGGLDSMVMLHVLARVSPERIAAVATFDHRTGAAATEATAHVSRAAEALSLPFVSGHASEMLDIREGREAAWRAARYAFLAQEADARGARVATAHTEDDQVETVLMRVMRGSGARGLAALYAASPLVRPFVRVNRATLRRYARASAITWVEDPSNQSRDFLRNRIRHDLLPALRRECPTIGADLLALAQDAGRLRTEMDDFIDTQLQVYASDEGQLHVGAGELAGLASGSLMAVWNALAGRVGLSLDRRGTRRIAEFTMKQPRSGWIPLAGGWQLEAQRGEYRLYRSGVQSRSTPQARGNRSVRQTGTILTL